MEKSIEAIWKEGFIDDSALVAPKLNDLYNQKSIHIIDKFKRMFKMNLILIVLGSFIILAASFAVGLPYMGVPMFIAMNVLVFLNKKLLNTLMLVDKGKSSYAYLMAFDAWLKYQVSINKRFSRFFYPFIFLSLVLGFWMKKSGDLRIGDHLVNKLLIAYPDLILVNGVPLLGVIGVVFISVILVMLGGRIYEWDLKIIYGRVFKKLDEIIIDINELRA
ncbi:hypothetical protein [Carboxylicivirga sp. M1479]|uniref:hypothetical protein n=1 Tax=Carboxylicivirga sp. M1479 TaxID=2594476 RepID=UPI001177FFFE|nr:hypothetical protein [Carboxylicivirga sp. M1479]TRX61018.1 hypothetical protein FNN09_20505 [Carboxylicivirga sp. M1479]